MWRRHWALLGVGICDMHDPIYLYLCSHNLYSYELYNHGLYSYMAFIAMGCMIMSYIVMNYIVMEYISMVFIDMGYILLAYGLYNHGLYSYNLYDYGLYTHGLYRYDLYKYDLYSHGRQEWAKTDPCAEDLLDCQCSRCPKAPTRHGQTPSNVQTDTGACVSPRWHNHTQDIHAPTGPREYTGACPCSLLLVCLK